MNKYITFTHITKEESKLTSNIINTSINQFWKEVMKPLNSNQEVTLIYRVVFFKNNQRVTLLRNKTFNSKDLNFLQSLMNNLLKYNKDEKIKNSIVNKVIIKYKVLDGTVWDKETLNSKFKLTSYRLPMTMDLTSWGFELYSDNNITVIKKRNTNLLYKIKQIDNLSNTIEIMNNTNKVLLNFKDIRNEGDPINTFVRIFEHHIYYIYNGNRYFKLNKRLIK